MQNKLRAEMAREFIACLEQEQLPWQACWKQVLPQNAISGKPYHGINALWLSHMANVRHYEDPRWCTFLQAQEKGWQIKRGAKACHVEYWAYYDTKKRKLLSWKDAEHLLKTDREYALKNLQLCSRIYAVFNGEQIDGIAPYEQGHTDIGILRHNRDTLLRNMDLGYKEEGFRAYYDPSSDTVTLPSERSFQDSYGYMCTFLHECGHATGHATRLNRPMEGIFGSPEYAREELRAEIASAFTAQALGLQLTADQLERQMDTHKAYIQSWAKVIEDAPDELFRAIKDADSISDYLIEKGDFENAIEDAKEHREQLYENWSNETNDPETQEWRDTLSPEDARLVDSWDIQYNTGIADMCADTAAKTPVGEATFADGSKLTFYSPQKYLKFIREELDYMTTTGFRYQTFSQDPELRKAVDDILYDFYGMETANRIQCGLSPDLALQRGNDPDYDDPSNAAAAVVPDTEKEAELLI